MFYEEIRKMNIKTKTLFERYQTIADERMALIMACVEGGQPELCDHILEQQKQDQSILMEETLKYLIPRDELYPEPIPFSLDDFVMEEEKDDIEKNNTEKDNTEKEG